MSASERDGSGVSDEVRRATTARAVRRVLAVPFWVLLALCVVSWPCAAVMPDGVWNVARVLGTLLLVPVALVRTIVSSRVLGLLAQGDAGRRSVGGVYAVGVFAGTFLLSGAAAVLAPALAPTVRVTATVTECHPGPGRGDRVDCTGSWTADGTAVTRWSLPVTGTPGGTVRFPVRRDDAHAAFTPLTGSREALGAGLGVGGVVVLGVGLLGHATLNRRVRRRIDDVLTR